MKLRASTSGEYKHGKHDRKQNTHILSQTNAELISYYHKSRGKPKIPPADRILIDPGHKARKNPSDNADLGFQAVGPALHIMQLNVEGLSAAKRHITGRDPSR